MFGQSTIRVEFPALDRLVSFLERAEGQVDSDAVQNINGLKDKLADSSNALQSALSQQEK